MFASLACELSKAKARDKSAKCADVRKKLRDRLPDFDTFELAFRRIIHTKAQTKQKNLVKYVLARIAEHNHWAIDNSESTIEHFMPQSAGLPEPVVGQIGNLILVPPKLNNEKLGDKDVAAKRKILRKAKYPIPDAMDKPTAWGQTEIENHTESLATLSYRQIWKI